jgi:hypothetical protein
MISRLVPFVLSILTEDPDVHRLIAETCLTARRRPGGQNSPTPYSSSVDEPTGDLKVHNLTMARPSFVSKLLKICKIQPATGLADVKLSEIFRSVAIT